jgi:hypothetical protein
MRALRLTSGLIGILVMAAPMAAQTGGNVKLREIEYERWSQQSLGDPLPVGGPVIRVFSERGDRFSFIGHANEPVRFLGLLSGSCPRVDEISSLQFEVAEQSVSVSHPDDPGAWFSRTGVVELSRNEPKGFHAVRECNARLKTLAARTGRSRSELVAKGFGIRFRNWIGGRAILTCGGRNDINSDTARLDIWVQCGGTPKAAELETPSMKAVPESLSPLVADLTFEVDHPRYVGKCPVGLQFTGSITTSRAGSISYRSVAHDGNSSPIDTLTFAAAGTKVITTWGETLGQPDPSGAPAAATEDEGPDYEGWRRLEIVAPAGFAPSSSADYSVICQE